MAGAAHAESRFIRAGRYAFNDQIANHANEGWICADGRRTHQSHAQFIRPNCVFEIETKHRDHMIGDKANRHENINLHNLLRQRTEEVTKIGFEKGLMPRTTTALIDELAVLIA